MTTSAAPIRLGICGAGKIVETHLGALARVAGFEVVAVSSRSLASAERIAARHGIPRAFGEHRAVIESPDVEAVLIATPNFQHHELTVAAARAGKHVMLEKPLAVTEAEGEAMVAAADDAGVRFIYAEQLPVAPKSMALAHAARAGKFGRIHMVRQIERHAGPHSPWFFQREFAGGGVLMDLGCHSIAVILDLLPARRVQRITCVTRTFVHAHGDVEDFAILQMQFDDGTLGVAENSWCHLGGMDSITEVFGERGSARADLYRKGSGVEAFVKDESLAGAPVGWQFPQYDPYYENGYIAQFEAARRTIREGSPAPYSGEDGLRVLRIMLAGYRSAERGGAAEDVDL